MSSFETFNAYFARLIGPESMSFLTVLVLIAFLLRRKLSSWLKLSVGRTMWISIAGAAVIVFCLRIWDYNGYADAFWLFDQTLWPQALNLSANWLLNAVLFMPLAALLVLARRPLWLVVLALAAMSFAIETIQAFTAWGVGDPADFVANSSGAILGSIAGWVLARLFPRLQARR